MPPVATRTLVGAALVVAALILSTGALPSAQAPGVIWLADDVADVTLGQPNCTRYPRVNGFDFAPDGTPMVGWTQVEGCGGSNDTYWSEKLADGWLKRQWGSQGFWGTASQNGSGHEFAVGNDGRPYLFMVGGNSSNLTYHTYRADLRAYADGTPGALVSTGEHVGNHQECIYVRYKVDGGPGQAWPYRVTARGHCTNSGPFRFEGQSLTADQLIRGFDLAMDADGRAHVAYINVNGHVMYMRPGTAPAQVATVNYYSDEVAIQPGPNGTVHIVARGLDFTGELDRGVLGYFRSSDDGATWAHVDNADASRVTYGLSLQLDPSGAPAVAYWRYGQGLYYTSRASGAWVESRVVRPGFSGVEWVKPPYLRFDAAGVPHIAYYDWTSNRIRISSPWPGGGAGGEPPVDLRVTGNASPNPTVAGTQVTYTLDVANAAAREASGVRVRVTLPAGATASSLNPAPISNAAGVLTFDAWRVRGGGVGQDRLASGATGTITINVSGLTTGISELPVVVSSTEEDAGLADNSIVVTARINAATCALPVSGRTAWWPGDGTSLNYGSGPAYHGTAVGGVSYGPGAVGQAFVFDGATGYLHVDNGYPEHYWPGTGSTSVAVWFATSVVSGTAAQVIASQNDTANAPCCGSPQGYAAWYLYVQGGVVRASMHDNGYNGADGTPWVVIEGTTPVADGAFHHAALVIDRPALQARLYVNGVLDASAALHDGWTMSNGDFEREPLVIGASQAGWSVAYANFFAGAIDDVALYKRVLTATEIANAATGPSLRQCGAPNQAPAIVGPGDQIHTEGEIVTLALEASDPESDPLSWSATGLPGGIGIDPGTGAISGTLPYGSAGSYPVTVTVRDPEAQSSASFTWAVQPGAPPPSIDHPGDQHSEEGETISLPLTWSVGEGKIVAFMATGLPPGLAIAPNTGVISGTLTMESSGSFQVTVTVSDGVRDTPITFWWFVDDMNREPVAVDDALEIDRNTPTFTIPASQLLANDSDPDGDDLFIIAVGGSTNGLAVLREDGHVDFTVDPVFHGTASFVYDASDRRGGSAPANVVITVTLVNEDPVAADDAAVTQGGPVTIDVLVNDRDPDGDPVTITGITQAPAKGTATIAGSSITYTPTSMTYNGADSFAYAISDGLGGTASATVVITTPAGEMADLQVTIVGVERDPESGIPLVVVLVKNDGPAAASSLGFSALASSTATIGIARVRAGPAGTWCDMSGGGGQASCTVPAMAPGDEAMFELPATPLAAESPRTFQLSAHAFAAVIDPDYGNNAVTAPVTIPLVVSDLAVSLEASHASYRVGESVTFTAVVTNHGPDASVSSALALTFDGSGTASTPMCSASGAASGQQSWFCSVPSLAEGDTWTVTFEQVASVAGTRVSSAQLEVASMAIWMTDPVPGNNFVEVVTEANLNRAPVAVDDPIETDEDTPLEIVPATLLANDTDADGDTLTIVAVSDSAVNGTVTFEAGVIVFTPAQDFHGAASFQYRIDDGHDATAWGTVHITVHSVNDEPAVPDQLVNAVSGVPLTVAIGATDVDGDKLAYAVDEGPAHGTAEIADDTVVYTADAGFDGIDTIVVRADDGAGGVATGRIRVQVTKTNDPPVFESLTVEVSGSGPVSVTLAAVDPDGDTLSYRLTVGPEFGAATLAGDQLTYTPEADFEGSEKIELEADDGRGGTTRAQVTFVVTLVNQPPFVASPVADVSLLEDALPFVVTLDGVFKDAEDVDGLTYTASSDNPDVVTVSVDSVAGTGTLTLTLVPDAFGVATVTVVVSDGEFTVQDQFLVTVAPVNDPPRLDQPANVRVVGGTQVVVPLAGLAAGPANELGQVVTVTAVSSGPSVTGPVTATFGEVRFTPPVRNNVGVATVMVEVADNGGTENGGQDRTTRTFTVTILPPPPTLTAPEAQVDVVHGTVSLPVTFTAYPEAELFFTAVGLPPGLSIAADTGVISGTLGSATGTYPVTVILYDGLATSSATFTWQVALAIVEIAVNEQIWVTDSVDVRPSAMITVDEVVTVTDTVDVMGPVVIEIDEVITVTETVDLQAMNTPTGNPLVLSQGGVTLRFREVTVAGQTTVEPEPAAPALPAGFVMAEPPLIYDIATTAQFTGGVEVCVAYDPLAFKTSDQRLFHHTGSAWTDITTSNRRDTSTVCGTTTHFSPFAVVEPVPLDGRIIGNGRIETADADHEFHLHASEGLRGARPNDRLRYEVTTTESVTSPGKSAGKGKAAPPVVKKVTRTDRFEATAIQSVRFYDDPAFGPGKPKGGPKAGVTVDSVVITGAGAWNGASGYTFEARAEDRGEPGKSRDTFAITIRSPQGAVVATVDGVITAGNIQSKKVGKR